MKKEFSYHLGWKIVITIFLLAFIAFLIFLATISIKQSSQLAVNLGLFAMFLGLIALCVIGLIDIFKAKLIIEDDKIKSIGVFKTKTLLFSEIKGIKLDQNYLRFLSNNPASKNLLVSVYYGKFTEIKLWASERFVDIDMQELIINEKQVLENELFGDTEEERQKKLIAAKKTIKVLSVVSWIVALSFFIFPHFYQIQTILCAIIPIVGLLIWQRSKGMITLAEKPNAAQPSIGGAILLPVMALLVRALMDINIFSYDNLLKPLVAIVLLVLIFVIKAHHTKLDFKKAKTYFILLGTVLLSAMYAFGIISISNTIYDNDGGELHAAEVLDMRISTGKSTSYYLKLSPWGPQTEIKDESVSKTLYENTQIGDSAFVYFSDGLYNIPYYIILE